MRTKSNRAMLAFLLITFFWGITFPLIRLAVQAVTPAQFVVLRFGCALLFILPLAIKSYLFSERPFHRDLAIKSFGLGILVWICYQTQTIGLQTVESGRAAFITGTSVIMIPLLSPLFGLKMPTRIDLLAAVGALSGLYLLTDPSGINVSAGDFWVMLCALDYAIYVHILQRWIKEEVDTVLVSFFQILGVFTCSLIMSWSMGDGIPSFSSNVFLAVIICAFFATVLSTLLQTRFQPQITPEKAALIFSMESVFASVFGFCILGELLSPRGFLGCSVILGSIITSEFLKAKQTKLSLES